MTRDLRLVALALAIWGVGEGMFVYFQPLYIQQLGASPLQIGAILGAAGVAMAVAHIPAGALADHIGRKQLMVTSWVVGTVAGVLMFQARTLPIFIVGLLLYWLTTFVMSPMSSYITAARGTWSVARALTTVSAGFSLGAVIGPLVGGQLAEAFGLRSVYGVAVSLFVLSTALILFLRPQPIEAHDGPSRYRALLGRAGFMRFLALAFAVALAMYLSWPLTPNFLQDVRHVSIGQIGLLGSFNALGATLFGLVLGRFPPRRGYLITQAITGLAVLLLWRGLGIPWLALGYFMAGGFRTARSLVSAQVQGLVLPSEMGLAYGIAETVQSGAWIAAPTLAGLLYTRDPGLMYPVGLGMLAVTFAFAARFAPHAAAATPPVVELAAARRD